MIIFLFGGIPIPTIIVDILFNSKLNHIKNSFVFIVHSYKILHNISHKIVIYSFDNHKKYIIIVVIIITIYNKIIPNFVIIKTHANSHMISHV